VSEALLLFLHLFHFYNKKRDRVYKELVSDLASKVAAELGVNINKVSLRKMKTKWAVVM
jgi:predicted metal-dependent hydrolase